MNEAEAKILQMVEAGTITGAEAEKLLAALEELEPRERVETVHLPEAEADVSETIVTPEGEVVYDPAEPDTPDMDYFRHFWRLPFLASFVALLFSGAALWAVLQFGGALYLLLFCLAPFFGLAMVATLLTLWSRWAYWIHIRVHEKRGKRIAISLPVPLRLMGVVLRFAGRHAGKGPAGNLATVSTLLESLDETPKGEPLMIAVDDEDGDRVRIFIG
jgi:hypothetical protein